MTPPARLQAAIDVLAKWYDGVPIEKALTNWARGARYAGSKDRAAVRDIVFDCLRKRVFYQVESGVPDTARGLVIAHASQWDVPLDTLFVEGGYGPLPLSAKEQASLRSQDSPLTAAQRLECPEWMVGELGRSLGVDAEAVTAIMRDRADIHLRVNTAKADVVTATKALAAEGIETKPHPLSDTALRVLSNPRRIAGSKPYMEGVVELQDAASQAVVQATLALPQRFQKILDFCAGGGGKSLALAVGSGRAVFATDINPKRMRDIHARAARSGCAVTVIDMEQTGEHAPYDLVFCDAPCSGSGAWRRNPEGKWRLTPERASEIRVMQRQVLANASRHVAPEGLLAYATCSILRNENEDQVEQFLRSHPDWICVSEKRFSPLDGGDGFYIAHLMRN